jgi:MFS family permease
MVADGVRGEVARTRWSIAGLLVSDFCGSAAALAQVTILGKVVFDLTGSELNLGLLGLAEFAPALLLVIVSGTIADRVDRRKLVAVAALTQAVIALVLGWYVGTNPTSVAPIFVLVVASGTALAFSAPAGRSLPADAVEPERLPWLIARSSIAFQAGIIAGPVLGGFLYTLDIRLPFVAVAGFLVVMSGAVMVVRLKPQPEPRPEPQPEPLPEPEPAADRSDEPGVLRAQAVQEAGVEPSGGYPTTASQGTLQEATEGLRFVKSQPILLGAISLDLLAVLFGGAVALLPAIAKDRLGVGAIGLGWLRAAVGIGAGAMTAVLAVRPITRSVGRTLLGVVAMFGAFTIVLGVTRTFAVAFVALVALSAADAVSVFIRATLVPLLTPAAKRGRVLAVENVFIGGSNEFGAFESGVTGQLLGTSGSVVLGGAVTIGVSLGWWFLFPRLREVDGFPVANGEEPPPAGSPGRTEDDIAGRGRSHRLPGQKDAIEGEGNANRGR